MDKFLGEKRVSVIRGFVVQGVSYSEVNVGGMNTIVQSSDLTDEPSNNVIASVVSNEGERHQSIVTVTADETRVEFRDNEAPTDEDKVMEVKVTEVEPEAEIKIEPKSEQVVARNKNGKVFELGSLDELKDSKRVKSLRLDIEAIDKCLNGKQKMHKGYTFELI